MIAIDHTTRDWIRNESDQRAARAGCRVDLSRAANEYGTGILDFIEGHLRLYEGEFAGELVALMDWQRDFLTRLFCWVRWSDHWGREVRRFRKASLWVPKKNGKSPLAAMVGLYLLCADGEKGQKVFSAAKDGQQAAIMHAHALAMVEQSEALGKVCKINKSTGKITHLPSRSTYTILAGDNIKGQEGINGSIIIDETHVVDKRLAKVIEYAGASRSEPMQLEVSTAGDNPDGYGKRQFDYGQDVEAGKIVDEAFLFQYHGAAQDANDDDCREPEVWKAANPSWGTTINGEEFAGVCERAGRTVDDFATFKKYRLNIWQQSTNPWLKAGDWSACRREFCEADLAGAVASSGLDLSKTQDMTSFSLVFRNDDGKAFRVLPYFWMPEETAREKNHLASFLQWASDGHLILIPGRTINQNRVFDDIAEIVDPFRTAAVAYDKLYAEEITARIEAELGIERVEFSQSMMNLAGPTDTFEALVLDGRLHHNGHPVLGWQAGHVNVKSDNNANKRPIKPKKNDHRKIDGIIATIMGLALAEAGDEGRSVYEDRGVLTF